MITQSYGKSSIIYSIEGRDKFTKIFQFLAKFLAWYSFKSEHEIESKKYIHIAGKIAK